MAEGPPSQGTDLEQKKSSEEDRENEDQNKSASDKMDINKDDHLSKSDKIYSQN